MSIIGLQHLFILAKNNKGTRGQSLKLTKMRSIGTVGNILFLNRVVNRWNMLDQHSWATSLIVFKNGL